MLELTAQKASDLNDIIAKALEKGETHSDGFEIYWYNRSIKEKFTEDYCYHLHSLMKYYNEKYDRNWVTVGDRGYVRANANTGFFFTEGGYEKILEIETRDHKIKELTEQQLQKTIWQIKGWWIFLLVNAILSLLVALLVK